MKRTVCLLLCLVLFIALCACGITEPPATEAPTSPPAPTEETPAAPTQEPPSQEPETTAPPKEEPTLTVPLTEEGIPTVFDVYVEQCLEKYGITAAELEYTLTELATGTVTVLDNTERLLRGFRCGMGAPVADPEGLFADAAYVLRISAPDGAWYMEYHDGINADYVYLSDLDLYVPLLYRVDETAKGISAAIGCYAEGGTLVSAVEYTGQAGENSPEVNVRDAVNEEFSVGSMTYSRVLPQIELPGAEIAAINEEILQRFSRENMASDLCTEVSYRWALNGDVLSLLIVGNSSHYGGWQGYGCATYRLYNISVSEGRRLSNDEVYAASGLADVQTRVLHAIVSYGAEAKATAMPDAYFHDSPENPNTLYGMVTELCELNFLDADPYFDENGKLCVVGYIRTNLGSGGFYDFVCVEDYETEELRSALTYYEQFSECYGAAQ